VSEGRLVFISVFGGGLNILGAVKIGSGRVTAGKSPLR
jgi:hypothetical protein